MKLAIVLVLLVIATLLFHWLSPWWFTPLASNWGAVDTTVDITLYITGFVFVAVNIFMAYAIFAIATTHPAERTTNPRTRSWKFGLPVLLPSA